MLANEIDLFRRHQAIESLTVRNQTVLLATAP